MLRLRRVVVIRDDETRGGFWSSSGGRRERDDDGVGTFSSTGGSSRDVFRAENGDESEDVVAKRRRVDAGKFQRVRLRGRGKPNPERVRGVLRALVPFLPKVGTDMERVAERTEEVRERDDHRKNERG